MIIKYAGIAEVLRFGMLIYNLGLEGENEN